MPSGENWPGWLQGGQVVAPKGEKVEGEHGMQAVFSALGTLPGLHELQDEEPGEGAIMLIGQGAHVLEPPAEKVSLRQARNELIYCCVSIRER